jgi:two-component system cell cycle sensor histidine kinase PleC
LNFRALVAPVFVAVVVSVTAFVLLVIFAARVQDEQALESEKTILQQEASAYLQRLQTLTEDNAWWDVTAEKIILVEDLPWIEKSLGATTTDLGFIDGTMVLRPDFGVIYSFHETRSNQPIMTDEIMLRSELGSALAEMNIDTKDSISGLFLVKGKLVALAATLVQSNDDALFEPALPAQRPVLIFYSTLTDYEIELIGLANTLHGLKFSPENAAGDNTLLITGINGDRVGWLTWQTKAPGTDMALDMVWPAIFLLALVVFAMVRFVRQAIGTVEALNQANKSKSAFLASMSHEVRTPLNSVLGFAELMSLELFGKIEGDKNKEYLQLIKDSGGHLLTIINDILDISKLEAGKFDVYAEEVKPDVIVQDCVKMVEPNATERGITLTHHTEKASLHSDERIIRQILINILSNAIKFTPKGGAVHVLTERGKEYYQILVTDNGCGMSEKEIEIALTTFGQVKNTHTKQHSGTGLGLPLVARFITLLDGKIHITSNPSKGTSVTLYFPYKTNAKNL